MHWAARAPEHFTYELFLDDQGQKISKSSGNGISIDEWLTYASTESLSYFMYRQTEDGQAVVFRCDSQGDGRISPAAERAYHGQDIEGAAEQPGPWHIHNGDVPESKMVVPFSMLLNLASAAARRA